MGSQRTAHRLAHWSCASTANGFLLNFSLGYDGLRNRLVTPLPATVRPSRSCRRRRRSSYRRVQASTRHGHCRCRSRLRSVSNRADLAVGILTGECSRAVGLRQRPDRRPPWMRPETSTRSAADISGRSQHRSTQGSCRSSAFVTAEGLCEGTLTAVGGGAEFSRSRRTRQSRLRDDAGRRGR
jgi:hypothetical protein